MVEGGIQGLCEGWKRKMVKNMPANKPAVVLRGDSTNARKTR